MHEQDSVNWNGHLTKKKKKSTHKSFQPIPAEAISELTMPLTTLTKVTV